MNSITVMFAIVMLAVVGSEARILRQAPFDCQSEPDYASFEACVDNQLSATALGGNAVASPSSGGACAHLTDYEAFEACVDNQLSRACAHLTDYEAFEACLDNQRSATALGGNAVAHPSSGATSTGGAGPMNTGEYPSQGANSAPNGAYDIPMEFEGVSGWAIDQGLIPVAAGRIAPQTPFATSTGGPGPMKTGAYPSLDANAAPNGAYDIPMVFAHGCEQFLQDAGVPMNEAVSQAVGSVVHQEAVSQAIMLDPVHAFECLFPVISYVIEAETY